MKRIFLKVSLFVLILAAATSAVLYVQSSSLNEDKELTQLEKDRSHERKFTEEELMDIPTEVDISNRYIN